MSTTNILQELRLQKGIRQKELAKYLGCSAGTISNYENGIHSPDLNTLIALSAFYGVSTDYLLGLTEYPHCTDIAATVISDTYTVGRLLQLLPYLNEQDKLHLAYSLSLLEALRTSKTDPNS